MAENNGFSFVPKPYDFQWLWQVVPSPSGPVIRLQVHSAYGTLNVWFSRAQFKQFLAQGQHVGEQAGAIT